MFTGIVEESGKVVAVRPSEASIRLVVEARRCGRGVRLGDSIAVNGCCLTVVRRRTTRGRTHLEFDLLQETWDRTNLSSVSAGTSVNLERSLAVGDRLGGHFVTGHIDGTGTIARWERRGADHVLDIAAPAVIRRQVVFKGSIAVDGISLTVADVLRNGFRIWIIPHTQAVTALRERRVGDRVNLETDLLGKYVEQMLGKTSRRPGKRSADPSGRIGRAASR
ncbi:MAG: riboflavin synthase [Verrucomicrobiae bacterium]|nr:riboflavin synthase [Verrucomicrobiae bacterium]